MKRSYRGISIFLFILAIATVGVLVWRSNRPSMPKQNRVAVLNTVVHVDEGAPLQDPKPARRYKIGVLFPFLASPFWVNEAYGILDQAKKLNIDVVWLSADGYNNIAKQNSQIEDLEIQHVNAILLAATSATGTVPAVNGASAKGIPVFAHVTSSDTGTVVSAVIDDDVSIGRKQGEFMGKALGGKGQVAMLDGPAAADWAVRRVQGFKEVLAQEYPGIRIVAERYGTPDRDDALRLTQDILSANPHLNGIFTVADGMAMGTADAVVAAGRMGAITITTASFSRESIPYMEKGFIKLNVDENPVLMGRLAINDVVNGLNGTPVPRIIYVPNPAITDETLHSVDPAHQWAPPGWTLH